ncbi:MAG: hypothetical protein AAF065_15325, partial [Verrucomicrobiota bacterium]
LGFSAATDPDQELAPLPGYAFYTDVELSSGADTLVELQFENNAFSEFTDLRWVATDVLTTGSMTIRKGDSLLLTAIDAGDPADQAIAITVDGDGPIAGTENTPVEYLFDTAGVYTIAASVGSLTGILTVEVMEADLGDDLDLLVNVSQAYMPERLSAQAVVSVDRAVAIAETTQSSAPRSFELITTASEPVFLAARIDENGPVLGHIELKPYRLANNNETRVEATEYYDDGAALVEVDFVLTDIPDDIEVLVRIFIAGIVFEDGSIEKVLTAGDFDEVGRATLKFIMPFEARSAVCHRIYIYQGGELVGQQ